MKQRRRLEITTFRRRTTVILRERASVEPPTLNERSRRAPADQTQGRGVGVDPSSTSLKIQPDKRRSDHERED